METTKNLPLNLRSIKKKGLVRKKAQRNLNKPSLKAHLQSQMHLFLGSRVLNHLLILQNITP